MKQDKKIRMIKKKHKRVANRSVGRTLKDFPKMNSSPEDMKKNGELVETLLRDYRDLTPDKIKTLAKKYAELKATGNSDWQAWTIKNYLMNAKNINVEDIII